MITFDGLSKTYESSFLDGVVVSGGFTTRESGDMMNRETLLSYLRINQVLFKKLVLGEQIHSANVAVFGPSGPGVWETLPETDAIVTREKGVLLAVRTADCIPVLYADAEAGVIGVSHNGWRGTLKQISVKVIGQMKALGARPDRIRAVLGPGIGACCYDIDDDRYYAFLEEFESDFQAFPVRGGRRHLNLLKINYEILKRAGVGSGHVDYFPFCTSCNRSRFFSYRRDYRKHREQFGEMLGYIVAN